MQAILPFIVMSSSLYAFCDFGDRITQEFKKIEIEFYQLPWYLLPMDMQKKLPLMIAITQKEVVIKGFGSTSCNRESFTQVSCPLPTNFEHFFLKIILKLIIVWHYFYLMLDFFPNFRFFGLSYRILWCWGSLIEIQKNVVCIFRKCLLFIHIFLKILF